jgi:feruloyl esterase
MRLNFLSVPDLSAFKARGGKLIMYHGWSDNLIMPQGTTRYYERVKQTMGDVSDFSRLYMVGGMGHCSGGTNVDQFGQGSSGVVPREPTTDVFRALMAWSEKGVAPRELVASRIAAGVVTRTRPLCPYPQVAKYKGSGSTDEAANFSCTSP